MGLQASGDFPTASGISTGRESISAPEAAASAPPPYFRFSTRGLERTDKFEAWRNLWGGARVGEADVTIESPGTFDGEIEMWGAGALTIIRLDVQSSRYHRTPIHARNGADDFSLTLCGDDMNVSLPDGETLPFTKGGAFFLAHDRPYVVKAGNRCPTAILRVDRKALLELMPRGFDLHVRSLAPGSPLLPLIQNIVPLVSSRTEPTPPERRAAIGQQIVDLIALLLDPSHAGRALIESRGLKVARLGAVLRAIELRFADSAFSAETIGHELDISGRQVHRLLAETTKTFYEHLLERRLLHAYELLSRPLFSEATIAEIAAQAGFTNVTHFNRLFRARFGDTPSGVRATATTGRTPRHLC
ncbi:MAG: AraC family transcriptional regulator [Methyloceanibacter sp.]|uniref:AraC family transcriptional regulator n=1 Tax=Methyloceanibacter sp. TaxID=1965321 RepID=UPI003D6D3B8B